MSHICTTVAAIILATVASSTQAQERRPFHTAEFPDSKTISLTITASVVSEDLEYDYDVSIGLIEHGTGGGAIFVDSGTHVVRVRCEAPSAVLVGGSVYILDNPPASNNWKEDLWKTLCLQPIS